MTNVVIKKRAVLNANIQRYLALIALPFISLSVSAGLITSNDVLGYTMVDFKDPTSTTASSAESLNGDIVTFTEKNGAALDPFMLVGNKNVAEMGWWSGSDDVFYYTDLSDQNWIELVMPKYTVGFSLAIDSNFTGGAWAVGVDDEGFAIDTKSNSFELLPNGNFAPNNPLYTIPLSKSGPAQTVQFYADNSGGSCNTISKVVIDPNYWGMGDFSIAVQDGACEVPEPSILALMGAGLAGLGFVRRRKARA